MRVSITSWRQYDIRDVTPHSVVERLKSVIGDTGSRRFTEFHSVGSGSFMIAVVAKDEVIEGQAITVAAALSEPIRLSEEHANAYRDAVEDVLVRHAPSPRSEVEESLAERIRSGR